MMLRIPMQAGARRGLTKAERAGLTPGLTEALERVGLEPVIFARPSVLARIASLWRGSIPVMALGRTLYWPGAAQDFSVGEGRVLGLLQHELQHLLDYAEGALTPVGYVLNPRNWVYRYRLTPTSRWLDFGAEQRAQIVQDLWEQEHLGLDASEHRRVTPWASIAAAGA